MNRIIMSCILVLCLIGAISAQTPNNNALAAYAARSGSGSSSGLGSSRGLSGMFPFLAMANGGNDALMPMMFCRSGMNFMCMMALSQSGLL